jgi:hypothetical protein
MDFDQALTIFAQQKLFFLGILLIILMGIASKLLSSPFSLYQRRKYLLTKTEVGSYYRLLPTVQSKGYELMAQVRIADVISVRGSKSKKWWNAFKQISSKHVDFVVVNPMSNFEIICAIEIDDASHDKRSRRARDNFINKAFKSAGVPLLRCPPGQEKTITKEIQ